MVMVPTVVTGPPEKVRPVVPPETSTLETVPRPAPAADSVIEPLPLVMVMPGPAVRVAFVRPPAVLPIRSWPLLYELYPVPPTPCWTVPNKVLASIEPPVMLTLFAFCEAIVPRPVTLELGIVMVTGVALVI
jgi:hypothetical protein